MTTLVPLHLYPLTSFPAERCCKRSSELLEMDQVHLFSSLFSNYFQILGIILKGGLASYCENIDQRNILKRENHIQQQPKQSHCYSYLVSRCSCQSSQHPLPFHEGEEAVLDVFFAMGWDKRAQRVFVSLPSHPMIP